MSQRVQTLAEQFIATNQAVIAAVEQCSESDWRARCAGEGRSVGVVAYHIAAGHQIALTIAQAGATGDGAPQWMHGMTEADGHQMNARQAEEHADCTAEEVVALLQRNGARVVDFIRGLSDEQLGRTVPFADDLLAEDLIRHLLIGHAQGHLASIRTTLGLRK
jgi:uncharacterized damage-inducible protein DinB